MESNPRKFFVASMDIKVSLPLQQQLWTSSDFLNMQTVLPRTARVELAAAWVEVGSPV